ncbi:acyltransferase [Luteimonas sp. MC1782]|nr:acyltransferase [Luteimonas sp. MC1782]
MNTLAALRHWARTSPHPAAAAARRLRGIGRGLTLPAPRVVVKPYLWLFLAARGTLFFLRRVLVAEPLFKAYCTRVGRGVTTGIHVPWVQGSGELVVGDHVRVSGLISINFAASFSSRPRLEIGDHSDIAHQTRFVVGREIRIGRHVQVAGGVTFRDSGGHPTDPERRRMGGAPDAADVKPIVVHDHAWIGTGVLVMPGTEIGEGAIVSAHAVVSGKVAPYSIVAGNPARRIGMVGQAAAA